MKLTTTFQDMTFDMFVIFWLYRSRNTSGSLDVHRRKDPEAVYQCMVRHQGGGLVLGYPVNLRYTCKYTALANLLEWKNIIKIFVCLFVTDNHWISWIYFLGTHRLADLQRAIVILKKILRRVEKVWSKSRTTDSVLYKINSFDAKM